MIMVIADFSQTRSFGKVDGQFLHARWRLKSPILDAQIGGWSVSFTRSVLESNHRFRSLSYTSYSGICLVVSRVRCVCYTPDIKVCLFVRRVGTFSYTPRTGMSLPSFVGFGVSLTRPVVECVMSFVG